MRALSLPEGLSIALDRRGRQLGATVPGISPPGMPNDIRHGRKIKESSGFRENWLGNLDPAQGGFQPIKLNEINASQFKLYRVL